MKNYLIYYHKISFDDGAGWVQFKQSVISRYQLDDISTLTGVIERITVFAQNTFTKEWLQKNEEVNSVDFANYSRRHLQFFETSKNYLRKF